MGVSSCSFLFIGLCENLCETLKIGSLLTPTLQATPSYIF